MAIGIDGLTGPEAEAFKLLTNLLKNRGALLLLIVAAVLDGSGADFLSSVPANRELSASLGKRFELPVQGLTGEFPGLLKG